ncbi:DJ-1/PfpI family protein [Mucilaginibacter sp. UR6-11]|uniref:DJ-1/PfpI family protein n=1 Tax=Mucilaginibacter sp. UR6-11 TaxID=1435644 RepID=UPI001E56326A|nr:DJ-1/PfpI family protein [Mucilaginibacter sp. UR6-11]MCC8423509.1 DJ-1/PfpI family protein [Mucilaginibacter sp. UR6-11]
MKKFKKVLLISLSIVIVAGGALALLLQPLFAFGQLPPYAGDNRIEWKQPVYDAAKKTVFIIADNKVTEMFDMLAPYYLFQKTGRLNVYIVAKEKAPVTIKRNLFILPQLTFREADSLKLTADVIVIPALSIRDEKQDPVVISFIKNHFSPETKLMAVCDGAATAAATGLFDGKPITCHASDLGALKTHFSKPIWIKDVNVAHSGNLYSTAGVSNAVEGSLMVINDLLGSQAMQSVAAGIRYPHAVLTNTHQSKAIKFGNMLTIAGKVIGRKSRRLGLVLQDGVSELDMVSVLDTYGRSFPKSFQCVTPADTIIHTRYGVSVICTGGKTAGKLDELHVLLPGIEAFISSNYPNTPVIRYTDEQYTIDACLARIKQQYGQNFQTVVKLMLDYN